MFATTWFHNLARAAEFVTHINNIVSRFISVVIDGASSDDTRRGSAGDIEGYVAYNNTKESDVAVDAMHEICWEKRLTIQDPK